MGSSEESCGLGSEVLERGPGRVAGKVGCSQACVLQCPGPGSETDLIPRQDRPGRIRSRKDLL